MVTFNKDTAFLTYRAEQDTICNDIAVPSPVWVSSLRWTLAQCLIATSENWVLVQFERIANYHSITEPRSGSDRVQLASLKSQENQIFRWLMVAQLDPVATAPRFCN